MTAQLRGVFAPIVTPFRPDDGAVDLPWLARHVAYLRQHGCTGIIACGTNGEAASLSVAERQAVAEASLAAAAGMPVVVGTGAAALPDAVALTRHAFACGAAAVLVMPPFYFKRPPDDGLITWYRRLLDQAAPPGGRVLLYHIPQLTAVPISAALIAALQESHGALIYGIKDSTGDPEQGRALRRAFPDLVYFAGSDQCVAEACAGGAAGSITACANLFPDLVGAVQQAAWEASDAARAQARLNILRGLLDRFSLQPATKAALVAVAGLPPTAVRPPQADLTPEQDAVLRAALLAHLPDWRPTVGRRSDSGSMS